MGSCQVSAAVWRVGNSRKMRVVQEGATKRKRPPLVDAVEGFPRVANAESFTISSRWELDGNDIAAKGKSIGVPIRFGDDAELVINDFDDTLKRIRNVDSFVLAEATSPISGSLSVKDSSVSAWWTVAIEGEKVVLNRRKHGLTVHVR